LLDVGKNINFSVRDYFGNEMFPLSKTEARIINYLYEHDEKTLYAIEIAKALDLNKRTVYRSLESLKRKGIVEEEIRGRMKFYRLSKKWFDVVKTAKNSTC